MGISFLRIKFLLFSFFLLSFLFIQEGGAFDPQWGHGPLPTRNYSPVALLFLNMVAEPAITLRKDQWRLTSEWVETNTVLLSEMGRVQGVVKLETVRSSFNIHYGLSDRIEVGLLIPVLYRFDGFLNPFILSVEEAFSKLNPSRVKLTNNEFEYHIDLDGKRIIEGGKDDLGLGDIVLSSKILLLSERASRPGIAFRMAWKFPTGDIAKSFGSGEFDIGMGLAAQKGFGKKWILYGNINGIFPFGDFMDTGLDLEPFYNGFFGVEYRLTPTFSILTQFQYYTTPFHGINAPILEDGSGEISLGISYLYEENFLWQIGAIENFSDPFPDDSGADFSIFTTFGYQFF